MEDIEAVTEQILQGELFEIVTKVYKKYNALLLVDQQDEDIDWFNDINLNRWSMVGKEIMKKNGILSQSQKGQLHLEV